MDSFYNEVELEQLGFASVGKNVKISRFARIYGSGNMVIGNNVRIDDFCLLSGKIHIGNNVHLAAYVSLFAGNTGIVLEDFVGISSRTVVYAESDEYTGLALTNPTVPDKYKQIQCGKVEFQKHSLIGTGCTVLPGVIVAEGASVGAMSLVSKDVPAWSISVGIPCKKVKERNRNILVLEQQYMKDLANGLEQ